MFDAIKNHPWLFGGTAVAAVLVIMYYNSTAPAASGATTGSSSDLAASEALQAAQLQANSSSQQYSTALQAQTEQDATQVALAKIQAQTVGDQNQLAAGIASKQLDVQQMLGAQANTLTAQVDANNNATKVQQDQIAAATTQFQFSTLASALATQANATVQINKDNATANSANIATVAAANQANTTTVANANVQAASDQAAWDAKVRAYAIWQSQQGGGWLSRIF